MHTFVRILAIVIVLLSHHAYSDMLLGAVKNDKLSLATTVVRVGAQATEDYLPHLRHKRVGLIVNQTSVLQAQHLADFLLAQNIDVQVLFAPEHGIRGNLGAGETVVDGVDTKTGIFIQSIYGDSKMPPDNILQSIDVLVFDIQDVGTRFYTYISSVHYMMQAAANHAIEFIVLDRPNPNGMFIDGPILEPAFKSFVGMHPIPILHGLTVGELALMIKGQGWIDNASELTLHVVPNRFYDKSMNYSLPIAPSPNLPNDQAVRLYPSLCFFEATAVSVGRGTPLPFQIIGHHQVALGDLILRPISMPNAAPSPKFKGTNIMAMDLTKSDIKGLDLSLLIDTYKRFKQQGKVLFTSKSFMHKLSGTRQIIDDIQNGLDSEQIKQKWQTDLDAYKKMRQPYLLYPESPLGEQPNVVE